MKAQLTTTARPSHRPLNRHSLLLLGYLATVLAVSFIHDVTLLMMILAAVILAVVMLLSWRALPILLKRTIYVLFFFNLTVSLGYMLMMWLNNTNDWLTLFRLNLRVFLLTLMSFSLIHVIHWHHALFFSPFLTRLMMITQSQILSFRRAQETFQLAFTSRSLRTPTLRDRYRLVRSVVLWLFDKAFFASKEMTLALRSRGFFND